ncbi:MAG: DHHA2 domain-containing protein, partial [Chloroflexota bacterium]
LVIGHRNPDMDAIASAVGYAWLLNEINETNYLPGRTGQVNSQTAFALDRFGVDAPALVTDVRPRVGDLSESLPYLNEGQTLLNACQTIARTRRPAPLLDAQQKPMGLLSGAGLFAHLAEALSSTSVLALAKEFDLPAETAVDSASTILNDEEFVRDVLGQVMRSDQDDFIVVDDNGRYVGLSRRATLMAPPHRKIVMVDHNELAQAVAGLEEAEVIEVLDHHRLSTIPTAVPIRFYVDPVGSCSTLVLERAVEVKKSFPAGIAGILLCGILSDTLVFRSPTATPRDYAAAIKLARMAKLAPAHADDEQAMNAISELGEALLASSAGLGNRSGDEVVSTDIKFYEESGFKVGIAQVEVSNFSELASRLDDIHEALQKLVDTQKLGLALLMVTDVVRGNSRLIAVGMPRIVTVLPYPRLDDDTLDAPGMMSRKKQLLPAVLAALAQAM